MSMGSSLARRAKRTRAAAAFRKIELSMKKPVAPVGAKTLRNRAKRRRQKYS
jgi:hypothetical protein